MIKLNVDPEMRMLRGPPIADTYENITLLELKTLQAF
jgi:hypothetical protein